MSIREKNIQSYFGKGIIVDTDPLVLLLAGYYDYDSIGKSKLTAEFTKGDFDLLTSFLSKFRKIIVTPHVLAEVSNLINTRVNKTDFADFIEKIIETLSDFKEAYVQKDEIISREELKKVGITDTGILLACERDNNLILTKDFQFKGLCISKGLPVIHFDRLRAESWFMCKSV